MKSKIINIMISRIRHAINTSSRWAEMFDVDRRGPSAVLSLHSIILPSKAKAFVSNTIGIIPLSLPYWLACFALLLLQSAINVTAAVWIYYVILPQRTTRTAYLWGYGVTIPALVALPFVILPPLPIYNCALLLCLTGASSALLIFRCVEAMHDCLPTWVTTGTTGTKQTPKTNASKPVCNGRHDEQVELSTFCLYYVSTIPFEFDAILHQPKRMKRAILWQKLFTFVSLLIQTSLLYSVLLPFHYQVWPRPPLQHLLNYWHPAHLANNYLMAALTSNVLEVGSSGLGLLTSMATGYVTMPCNKSPLTQSSSPSDFWGHRWNAMVQQALKRGCYQPLRQSGWSTAAAAVATFAVSGSLHEYVLYVLTLRKGSSYVSPDLGRQAAFFVLNGLLLWAERAWGNRPQFRWMSHHLPQPIRLFLFMLLILPIVHWFTDEYVACHFYTDAAWGFVRLVTRDV